MTTEKRRSEIYGDLADTLTQTCLQSLKVPPPGSTERLIPSPGFIAYAMGELHRCRPGIDLTAIHGHNLIGAMQSMIEHHLDLGNEVHRCFFAMGLGMFGPADDKHPVLGGVSQSRRRQLFGALIVNHEFDNNWEAFNGSTLIGRHILYGDPAEKVLPHFEKIAAKYDRTGYFDDTRDLGNYNNYGLMSINYALHAAEYLDADHPVRQTLEHRFKDHAHRYVELIRALVSPRGDTWPFGRSAGVLGQLQCITLIEQCLSKGWIDPGAVDHARAIARLATQRMRDLYWDDEQQWFNFQDDYQTAYDYRKSLPMAWDMLRYFLQIEKYAAADERCGSPERDTAAHRGPCHREIVTNRDLKTAIYVWSDGRDHAVLPVMAGPRGITGDTLPRPYAPGLFEWTTQRAVPALCPRLTIDGEQYWPAWRAARTRLAADGEKRIYEMMFDRLYSNKGAPCPHEISCTTTFAFAPGSLERTDIWRNSKQLSIDSFTLEVLQPAEHPHRPRFGAVRHLTAVNWESGIEEIELQEKRNVSDDPHYRSYHAHASHSWLISGAGISLAPGCRTTKLSLKWSV